MARPPPTGAVVTARRRGTSPSALLAVDPPPTSQPRAEPSRSPPRPPDQRPTRPDPSRGRGAPARRRNPPPPTTTAVRSGGWSLLPAMPRSPRISGPAAPCPQARRWQTNPTTRAFRRSIRDDSPRRERPPRSHNASPARWARSQTKLHRTHRTSTTHVAPERTRRSGAQRRTPRSRRARVRAVGGWVPPDPGWDCPDTLVLNHRTTAAPHHTHHKEKGELGGAVASGRGDVLAGERRYGMVKCPA